MIKNRKSFGLVGCLVVPLLLSVGCEDQPIERAPVDDNKRTVRVGISLGAVKMSNESLTIVGSITAPTNNQMASSEVIKVRSIVGAPRPAARSE
ncbi:MAG: hypothetical protein KTR25_08125 [Myxococcales bacterium]|nr:hypothetical protein [Myxococcales bacterium]